MNKQDIKVWVENNRWLRSLANGKNIDKFIEDNYDYLVEFIKVKTYGVSNGARSIKRSSE